VVFVVGATIAVAGCGTQTRTVTDVQIESVTQTVNRTVTVKPTPAAAPAVLSGIAGQVQLAGLVAQAVQNAVGNEFQISASASECDQNVDPGSFQCGTEDPNANLVVYNVTARGGRWTGTVDPSAGTGAATGGPDVPSGYPSTIGGKY